MLWRMAWRNLWRQRGRTLIMGSAVALSYALMLVSMGMSDDGHGRMLREAARASGGDVLVHARGYWAERAGDLVLRDGDRRLAMVRQVPGVRAAAPRVLINGLASTAADSRPLLLQGIDPVQERALRDISSDLKSGSFLTGGESDPLVLGSRLAGRLDARVGDRIVLTATAPDGELTRALFHLTGILETGTKELDEMLGYTTVAAARRAVGMSDGGLTQIGILVDEGADVDRVAAAVRRRLGERNGVEVLTWRQAVPEMIGFVEIDDALGYLYLIVIYVVVLFSITNTFLMAVLERVREFGLLSALGLSSGRIGRLLLAESCLLTALSLVAGFVLGFAGHLAIAHWGVSVTAWGMEEMEISGVDFADLVMRSRIVPVKWLVGTGLVAVATFASAVYPAWRASRLAPAEAMRFYE